MRTQVQEEYLWKDREKQAGFIIRKPTMVQKPIDNDDNDDSDILQR